MGEGNKERGAVDLLVGECRWRESKPRGLSDPLFFEAFSVSNSQPVWLRGCTLVDVFFRLRVFLYQNVRNGPVQVIGKCYTGTTSSTCQLRLSKYHQTCMYIFFSLNRRYVEVRTVKVKWECITHDPLFIYSSSFFLLALHVTGKDQFCSSFVLICRTQNVGYW